MSSHAERNTQNQKVARLWGNSWQKLSPKQQELVGGIMQDMNIAYAIEHLEAEAIKMPSPDFASVTQSSQITCFGEGNANNSIALTWQFVLAKTTTILEEQRGIEQLQILVQEVDYHQITKNAINDICAIVRKPANLTAIAAIETQTKQLQELGCKYFDRPHSSLKSLQEDIIFAITTSIDHTKSLGLLGLGAFTLIANLHVLLLQEKAKSEPKEWKNLSNALNSYITHAKSTTPQIFRLSVGKIDKLCTCIKYNSQQNEDNVAEYECRYSDGKDIYIFRDRSQRVGYECNKHRLKMFHSTVDRIMQTVQPVRSTVKVWEKLAIQISQLST